MSPFLSLDNGRASQAADSTQIEGSNVRSLKSSSQYPHSADLRPRVGVQPGTLNPSTPKTPKAW